MKNIIKLLMVLIVGISMTACGGSKEEKVTKIYVGTNAEFEPFEFQKDGKITGFDIDLINAIAKESNVNVEIKDMSFDGLLPALQSKKIDVIIAGLTATDERRKAINFTKPYYQATQVIITKKETADIKDFKELSGKKVGVILGFTGDVMVSKIDNVDKKQYNAAYAAIMDLQADKIDAVVLDSQPAKNFTDKNEGLKISTATADQEEYAIGISKTNPELLKKFDAALETLKTNGEYDKLVKKWF